MSCRSHGHLPSPLRPALCAVCHPLDLSRPTPAAVVGTTQATERLLSDLVGTLRAQLGESKAEASRLAARVESLSSEVAGLKRGLSQAKRQAGEGRRLLAQCMAEKQVILEAMEGLVRR